MADKKVRKSLESLRGDIQELAESFAAFRVHMSAQQAAAEAERQRQGIAAPGGSSATTEALEARTAQSGGAGFVSVFGYYQAQIEGEVQRLYRWTMEEMPAQELLNFSIEDHAHVLAAIGHKQRLGILLMILAKPATANDVVTKLALGTTGAAYHHLNVLQSAGLVEQQQRGTFSIVPNQIPSLLTILAGLSGAIAVDITAPEETDAASRDTDVSKGPNGSGNIRS